MRDNKGRFSKSSEGGMKITMCMPTLTNIIYWLLLLMIFMPWISIIFRLEILKKLLSIFGDLLMKYNDQEKEIPKKNGSSHK